MSFASQKNDMLLRNMIFRLNVEMIDSPKGEYDMFAFGKRDSWCLPMFLLQGYGEVFGCDSSAK